MPGQAFPPGAVRSRVPCIFACEAHIRRLQPRRELGNRAES